MAPALQPSTARTGSRLLSAFAILAASAAAIYLLFPTPLADAFFAGWVLISVILPLIGGLGVWTNRTILVWIAALLMTGLSIIGMWSIGFFIAPAALLLLGAALLSQVAGPRQDVHEAILADAPSAHEVAGKAVAGIGSMAVGGWLVYIGSITRDLFGACAQETLACALSKTHWDAVAVTTLGLLALSFGGWVLWKQVYTARVLASEQVR